jgi:hypothetical protein
VFDTYAQANLHGNPWQRGIRLNFTYKIFPSRIYRVLQKSDSAAFLLPRNAFHFGY